MYVYESWTIKKAESWRIDAFELWCWEVRKSNLNEINPKHSLEGLMPKLKFQYIGHLKWRVDSNLCPLSQWYHLTISSCRPLLLPPSIFPSIRGFSNGSALRIRWPKYWSFSFGISPSNEYSGLISFRNDWLDLLAVQGTLKSLLQHHCSKASILWHSAFFMVQLSHPYRTTGKIKTLTIRPFVGKVISLLFMLLVIAFLPGSIF